VLDSVALTRYVVPHRRGGAWYFAITALDADGVESRLSNIERTTVRRYN
jgi:hypothetical protein